MWISRAIELVTIQEEFCNFNISCQGESYKGESVGDFAEIINNLLRVSLNLTLKCNLKQAKKECAINNFHASSAEIK